MALIEIRDLYKIYDSGAIQVNALGGVSLDIQQGEFVVITGPSGSGKSTLMNILGCLDRPTKGQYRLNGQEVARMNPNQLADLRINTIGFVFQNFNLLSRTSAAENVELPLLYAGVPKRERAERVKTALSRVGLAERMDHHPNQLSGGQQQRVAIARALVTRPPLILADEPTGNLDSRTTDEVMDLFDELVADGITIVLVTHEPEIADRAKRVVIVRDGHIKDDRLNKKPAGPSRYIEGV